MKRLTKQITTIAALTISTLVTNAALAGTTPVETTNEFFDALKKNDLFVAYSLTDPTFRKLTPPKKFSPYVNNNSLNKTLGFKVLEKQRVKGGQNIYISLDRKGLKTIAVRLSFTQKGQEWLLHGLGPDERKTVAPAKKQKTASVQKRFPVQGVIPSEGEMIRMVNAAIVDFAKSVKAKDMAFFHSTASKELKSTVSVAKFNDVFKGFFTLKGDLMATQSKPFVFTQKPVSAQLGGVLVHGKWETRPSRVLFKARYVVEAGEWKLAAIDVNVKPVSKPKS